MLDALVAEARLRWGLDLAAGLQVIAAERLVSTPLEASRPVLLVPLAVLRAGGGDGAAGSLPGRHGPGGREPIALLGRLYPAGHAVGRFGSHDAATIGALTASDLAAPLYVPPLAPEDATLPAACMRPESPFGLPPPRSRPRSGQRPPAGPKPGDTQGELSHST